MPNLIKLTYKLMKCWNKFRQLFIAFTSVFWM